MIDVKADKDTLQITVPTQGMSAEQVNDFVTWLRVEAIARRSRLTPSTARQLAEDVKSDWWDQNKSRFGE